MTLDCSGVAGAFTAIVVTSVAIAVLKTLEARHWLKEVHRQQDLRLEHALEDLRRAEGPRP